MRTRIWAGPNEVKVYRPAGGQSVWLYHEDTGTIELRDSDGETLAEFDDPEDIFDDPTAYPTTEKDITDFDEWTTIKRHALPSRIDRDMVDVLTVTDDGLEVLEPKGIERRSPRCSRRAATRRLAGSRLTTSDADRPLIFHLTLCNIGAW